VTRCVASAPPAEIPENACTGNGAAALMPSLPGANTAIYTPLAGGVTPERSIRWTDPLPLAPGARVTFAYDVIVE